MTIYFAKRADQPRADTGHFASNGATPHEKARYHTGQAHIERVNANVARYNGDNSQAEIHDTKADEHEAAAVKHMAAALGSIKPLE
jgi:hypothetical protein